MKRLSKHKISSIKANHLNYHYISKGTGETTFLLHGFPDTANTWDSFIDILSKKYNWRTDNNIAPGGYFDDLASHGLDLFTFLLGDIEEAKGISLNQQNLYTAKDAITACWVHKNGVTGSGSWNFGCNLRQDNVEIYGSKGKIVFSVFDEHPIQLILDNKHKNLIIEHPEHIQYYHVKSIKDNLLESIPHPSTGKSGLHTSWVMDKILGSI